MYLCINISCKCFFKFFFLCPTYEVAKIILKYICIYRIYGIAIATPPRAQGLLTEIWQRRKRQK